jgi:Na+-transporting NADH:ubiquinone oxidoreductase subunit B
LGLRKFFDSIHHHFDVGGKYEKYYALYEMVDTFLYSLKDVTYKAPHARDHMDLKRMMSYVVVAAIPCILFALYNTGYQANTALQTMGKTGADGYAGFILNLLGIGFDPNSIFANMVHGLMYFLPIYIVTLAVGGIWEVIFAVSTK